MERRFAVRYEELMADAQVMPEALEGVLERLVGFVRPFAASLEHAAQRDHLQEYVTGLVSNVNARTSSRLPICTNKTGNRCRSSLARSLGSGGP